MIDHTWITILVVIGSDLVAGLSIYLGYRLFLKGAAGEFKFKASHSGPTSDLKALLRGSGSQLLALLWPS
jgi:hypothetical protein